MKCFFHSEDLDGHCAGAIVRDAVQSYHPYNDEFFRNKPAIEGEIEMIGINYGDPFPWDRIIDADETVFMVDFSLQPFEDMVRLNELCVLHWIDHHKTAIDAEMRYMASAPAVREGFPRPFLGLREIGKAGCELAWKYFHHRYAVPRAVYLLGRYDVWDHADPDVLPFQYGMRQKKTWPGDPDAAALWAPFISPYSGPLICNSTIEQGRVILDYIREDNRKYAEACAFEAELDGRPVIALNRMLTNSQLFEAVWDREKYHAMLSFGIRKGQWHISLYTDREDVDVGEIAMAHGGGGHKGAAGFQCNEPPFLFRQGNNEISDIKINMKAGLKDCSISLIQEIEKEIDKAMLQKGFSRTTTSKSCEITEFHYRQFAKCF